MWVPSAVTGERGRSSEGQWLTTETAGEQVARPPEPASAAGRLLQQPGPLCAWHPLGSPGPAAQPPEQRNAQGAQPPVTSLRPGFPFQR